MPTFLFQARDGTGTLLSGSIAADSLTAAVQSIRAEGKYPTSVQPAQEAAPARTPVFGGPPRMNRKDVLQFSTQLQIMIETGVNLTEAIDSIASQSSRPATRKVIEDLGHRIQSGDSFSVALSRHPRSFPRLMVALVAASEKSGMMAKLIGRAVKYLRDEQDIIRRVRGALTYPAIMLVFAVGTTCFLMTAVLPRFTAIYASKGATLPVLTRFLMSFSNLLIHQWPWIVGMLATTSLIGWRWLRTKGGRRTFHYVQLRTPLLGKIFQKLHLSRGLRLIGTMAGAGINLPDCVRTAYELCPNVFFQDLWQEVGQQIQAGKQFSAPLFQSPLVPKGMAQMLHSAEKGGKLATVMEQVATFAEEELKEQITEMTRYIEPAMIAIMGAIIGVVALALMLPIFTISKVIVK